MPDVMESRLTELEAIIDKHLVGFVEVGRALLEVRDEKLYRIFYPTFEAWARERFSMSRRRAYELMAAVTVRDELVRHGAQKLPTNERQARELTRLPEDDRARVWDAVLERAGEDEVTERHVRQAVRDHRRQEQVAELAAISEGNEELDTSRRWPIIMADPPWQYDSGTTDPSRVIENHYPTMSFEELKALEVYKIATDDAVLFMWAVAPLLPEALEVMNSWGFAYRTNLVWDKGSIGPGYWFRNQHEHLLLGVRGSPPKPAPRARMSSVVQHPRGKHSAKPPSVRDMIQSYYPSLPRIELFARERALGWHVWGNQA